MMKKWRNIWTFKKHKITINKEDAMNYEKLKDYRNSHNPFANLLNLVITDIQANYAAGRSAFRQIC